MVYLVPSSTIRSATATATQLCARLTERGIPYIIYSGFDTVEGAPKAALHVRKPAAPGELVAKMEGLILVEPLDPLAKRK